MPKYRVIGSINQNGKPVAIGEEIELPLNVAGDSAVRGHIEALDDEGRLAFTSVTDTVGSTLRAGAPLAEHEMDAEDAQLQSERAMFENRIKAIDDKLKSNAIRREQLKAAGKPIDTGAPGGPASTGDFAAPAPGTFAAPAGGPVGPAAGAGAPGGPSSVNEGPDVRHTSDRPGEFR